MKKIILGVSILLALVLDTLAQTTNITILTPKAISNIVTQVVTSHDGTVTIVTNNNPYNLDLHVTSGGGATNGIQQLGGVGTNTTLTNLTMQSGTISNAIITNSTIPLNNVIGLNTNYFVLSTNGYASNGIFSNSIFSGTFIGINTNYFLLATNGTGSNLTIYNSLFQAALLSNSVITNTIFNGGTISNSFITNSSFNGGGIVSSAITGSSFSGTGIILPSMTSNTLAAYINNTLSNIVAGTDGQTLVAKSSAAGGVIWSNFPTVGGGAFTTFIDPTLAPYNAAGNGTTDDTIALTNAFWSASISNIPVVLSKKFLFSSQLVFYTNTTIYGYGGTLKCASGTSFASGRAITTGLSSSNIHVMGLEIDGGNAASIPGSDDGRTGLLIFATENANCSVDHLNIHGFGKGLYVFDAGANADPQITINICVLRNNWIGLHTENGAEYISYFGIYSQENHFGATIGTGNDHFTGCSFDRNVINLVIDGTGAANIGHGEFVGCSFNHGQAWSVLATNVLLGEIFSACSFLPPIMYFTNCQGFTFSPCEIGWSVTNFATIYLNTCTNMSFLDMSNPYTITNGYAFNAVTNCLSINIRYPNSTTSDVAGNVTHPTNLTVGGTIFGNGQGITNLTGSSQSYTNLANFAATNYIPNLSSTTFNPITVSNANFLFFPFLSNGPGAVAVWLYPLGATNYTFGIPTNWVSPLQSNLATSGSGTNWVFTLTNSHRAKIVFESTSGVPNPNATNSAATINFY